MLKAKHNIFIYAFFRRYAVWKINRHFHSIKIIGEIGEKNLPVLVLSNHISWWDGFWGMYLNVKILHRRFHFMMLEEQLRKYWFFNYTGGFSINKKSKSILESLNYTSELLLNNKNMVLMYPQGEIQSMHNRNFVFGKGLERILKDRKQKIQIIFMAGIIDYFSHPKPSVYLYFSEYKNSGYQLEHIQTAYNAFYKQCIEKQLILTT